MKDPLDLLYDRLKEIDAVKCRDENYINYRNKFIATIRFLEINQVGKRFRKKLTPIEESYIRVNKNKVKSKEIMQQFNISSTVYFRIINEN